MRYYIKIEEWVLIKDGLVYVGLLEFVANELGDIVFVDLPRVGDRFKKEELFGVVELVKAASDLYMPISGEVYEVNELLEDNPELLNEDPLKNYIIVLTGFKEEELKDLIKK